MAIFNADLVPPVRLEKDSKVTWVPVHFHHLWRSKYKTSSRRKSKPHDWWIEIEVMVESRLPYELTCLNHYYVRKGIELKEEAQFKNVKVRVAYVTIRACGRGVELQIKEKVLAERPMEFYNYLVDYIKQMCGRELSKKTIREWLKVDLGIWFPEYYPQFRRVAEMVERVWLRLVEKGLDIPKEFPYLIESVSWDWTVETEVETVLVPVGTVSETYESADQFQEEIASIVDGKIEELIDRFIEEVYAMPIAIEYKEETEGGFERLKAECRLSTKTAVTGGLFETEIIEESTNIEEVSFRRSNNLDMEPVPYRYWEEELSDFMNAHLTEIVNTIVDAYVNHLNRKFGEGEE